MSELVQAFALGNAAILGNVCLLPLYPGLFALFASRAAQGARGVRWLGVWVLAGVLLTLTLVGAVLAGVNAVFADIVPYVVPVSYVAVIVLGVLLLLDRNPLARLGAGQAPVVSSNAGSAFLYGVALAPMTLPCTGPILLTAFILGGTGAGSMFEQLGFFGMFGLGFGWPLVLLPLLAGARQRQLTGFLTRNHRAITVLSGLLLVAVAVYGLYEEFGR